MSVIEFSAIPFDAVATRASNTGAKLWLIGFLVIGVIVLVYLKNKPHNAQSDQSSSPHVD